MNILIANSLCIFNLNFFSINLSFFSIKFQKSSCLIENHHVLIEISVLYALRCHRTSGRQKISSQCFSSLSLGKEKGLSALYFLESFVHIIPCYKVEEKDWTSPIFGASQHLSVILNFKVGLMNDQAWELFYNDTFTIPYECAHPYFLCENLCNWFWVAEEGKEGQASQISVLNRATCFEMPKAVTVKCELVVFHWRIGNTQPR